MCDRLFACVCVRACVYVCVWVCVCVCVCVHSCSVVTIDMECQGGYDIAIRTVPSRNLITYVPRFFGYQYSSSRVYTTHELASKIPTFGIYYTCLDVLSFCEFAFFEVLTVKEFT